MGRKTGIAWCDHTFNPWRGCTKVSPGCAHCYAEQLSLRNPKVLGEWGDRGVRAVAGESYWKQPLAWDRAAAKAGVRRRVFCLSLGDVFEDRPELCSPRQRLFHLIGRTPSLDWLLLTKRPENVGRMGIDQQLWYPQDGLPRNVWLGTSVENGDCLHRVGELLRLPAAAYFVSAEPLLGPLVLWKYLAECRCGHGHGFTACPNTGGVAKRCHVAGCGCPGLRPLLGWIIVGGESGPHARPCCVEWVRSLVAQCRAAGVACFVKQLGANPTHGEKDGFPHRAGDVTKPHTTGDGFGNYSVTLRDPKGGDPSEWPDDLRVREFPR